MALISLGVSFKRSRVVSYPFPFTMHSLIFVYKEQATESKVSSTQSLGETLDSSEPFPISATKRRRLFIFSNFKICSHFLFCLLQMYVVGKPLKWQVWVTFAASVPLAAFTTYFCLQAGRIIRGSAPPRFSRVSLFTFAAAVNQGKCLPFVVQNCPCCQINTGWWLFFSTVEPFSS